MTDISPAAVLSPARERGLLWLLALTQFTVITDFMVMMPLGPQIMRAFAFGPAAFAAAVSAYSWCAGLSGLFAATYVDRFDRKRLLLMMFALFALSNVGCALTTDYHLLLFARAFAGLTGGVMSSLVMAVIGDVIPLSRRGAATGIVMTSFSLAAVVGVPIGVVLGAHWGWQSVFYLLTAVCVLIWLAALRIVPTLTGHLAQRPALLSQTLPALFALLGNSHHLRAFMLTGTVMMANMLVVPFISPTLVANLGIEPQQISWIYMAGGVATLFTARAIGRLTDRYGSTRVFRAVALFSVLPLLAVTHLPKLPLLALIAFFPFFMVTISGRIIPVQALMTTVPDAAKRGAFLSVNAAIMSLGTGLGAWFGGLLLRTGPAGEILGYGRNGWIAAALTVFAVLWISQVRRAPTPVTEESVLAVAAEG